jgi:arylsulfatase A-like enzyme
MKLIIIYLSLALLFGCQPDENPSARNLRPPNIVWLVAEDISPALGCYGDPLAKTPNIDKIASIGIRFNKAFATAPICAPSRSTLMSGLYATSLGTQHLRCEIPFPDQLKTLPEHLSAAGYFTSNRNKTDYNFDPEGRWEHWSGSYAPWRHRKQDNQPFYSFINVGPSHEGSVNNDTRHLESIADIPQEQLVDPSMVTVPPYYPDNAQSQEVWARYYNVLQALDKNVGQVLDSLEADGLMDETVIFFFGDHGFGMPRYKRWLYKTGLHVPLLVSVPEKYAHLFNQQPGSSTDQMVSFVDFPATALNLAGVQIPEAMEGQPFLGDSLPEPRKYVFGARDRADDMYEMSRAVLNDRYIYIRHYMPHLPYIQSGFIYSDVKYGFRTLRAARNAGALNEEQQKLWNPKPVEELYDLQADPQELNNVAANADFAGIKQQLKEQMDHWMVEHKDFGLLPEAEYMIRSQHSSPYEYARNREDYQAASILASANMVGTATQSQCVGKLANPDSGVRYWATMALMQFDGLDQQSIDALKKALEDDSPSVQINAAETLCRAGSHPEAVQTLGNWVQDERPWVAMQAARSIQLVGDDARPLIPVIYEVLESNLRGDDGSHRKYKDFNYAAFTSWALEWALQELGEEVVVN